MLNDVNVDNDDDNDGLIKDGYCGINEDDDENNDDDDA